MSSNVSTEKCVCLEMLQIKRGPEDLVETNHTSRLILSPLLFQPRLSSAHWCCKLELVKRAYK